LVDRPVALDFVVADPVVVRELLVSVVLLLPPLFDLEPPPEDPELLPPPDELLVTTGAAWELQTLLYQKYPRAVQSA